ncbi:uncharacterized protein LOC120325492 [Styela clava]|uniref:uncharacterized protein LOC120325492 n=1 Tax=Styela clava TaxID=7725 RepID=UPI00193A3845|nr:uncharacterized protein LOC120325492 [Styela clava]
MGNLVHMLCTFMLFCALVTGEENKSEPVKCAARTRLSTATCPQVSSNAICYDACNGREITARKECKNTPECCFVKNRCVPKEMVAATFEEEKKSEEEKAVFEKFKKNMEKPDDNDESHKSMLSARNLNMGGFPGIPGPPLPLGVHGALPFGSIPSQSPSNCLIFPFNCPPVTNVDDILIPPVNIPYCQREYCSLADYSLEDNLEACLMQPGCYFDRELHSLRKAFGHRVLPTVPVCHIAIKNHFFQKKCQKHIQRFGKWNPALTKCMMTQHYSEIYSPPKGCDMNQVIEYFGYLPKMAGWTGILEKECYLINGCWRPGHGCFYPMQLSEIIVKSTNIDISGRKLASATQIFGMPKCQNFDSSTPENFLRSYHNCLSSGCSLDPSVTSQLYYYNLWNLTQSLPPQLQYLSWVDIAKSNMRADNFEEQIKKYQEMSGSDRGFSMMNSINTGSNFQVSHLLHSLTPTPNILGNGILNTGLNQNPLNSLLGNTLTGTASLNGMGFLGNSFTESPIIKSIDNVNCPYQQVNLYNFPPLKGSFTGCCEKNLCYLPKKTQNIQTSGIANYYATWTQWTTCTATCGGGQMSRTRLCVSRSGGKCGGVADETRECNTRRCPKWSQWSGYAPCSVTCGAGKTTRTRKCLGVGCVGSSQSEAVCNSGRCPVFSDWTPWSECSVTCGEGKKLRFRLCENGGDYGCPKEDPVNEIGCRSYCGKMTWSEWSECDYKTCTRKKTPRCDHNGARGYCLNFPKPVTEKCNQMTCYCRNYPGNILCAGYNG